MNPIKQAGILTRWGFLLLLLCAFGPVVDSIESPQEHYEKVMQRISEKFENEFQVTQVIQMFDGKQQVIDQDTLKLMRSGSIGYFKDKSSEVFLDKTSAIMVNHSEALVVVLPPQEKEAYLNLNQWQAITQMVESVKESTDQIMVDFKTGSPYQKMLLEFDGDQVLSIEVYYGKKGMSPDNKNIQKITITYLEWCVSKKCLAEVPKSSRYLSWQKTNPVLNTTISHYQIRNEKK